MSEHAFSLLFDDVTHWQVFASGQAEGRLCPTQGPGGEAGIRLDYDFHGGGGFVAIRRVAVCRLPETFAVGFSLCIAGEANNVEFKVVSPGGSNVWRCVYTALSPSAAWREYRVTERDLSFAWGPAGGGAPSEIEAVEFVVVAGPGGRGTLRLTCASFENQTLRAPAGVRASSCQRGCVPETLFSASPAAAWRACNDDARPWIEIDLGRAQRFGGLVLHWPNDLPTRAVEILLSDDATGWRRLYRQAAVSGTLTHVPAPLEQARFLRFVFERAEGAALRSVSLRPDAFSHTPNAFLHAIAADFPRGWFPRYWLREQSFWTVVGTPEGTRRALINEEGLVETDEAGFSLEPFVLTEAGIATWANVKTSVSLPQTGTPLPCVSWREAAFELVVRPWVDGSGDRQTLHVGYRLTRLTPSCALRLVIAARPCQVTPPWQAFRNLGGISPIRNVACGDRSVGVNGRLVAFTPRADALGAAAFAASEVPSCLSAGAVGAAAQVDDASGLACAEMLWNVPADRRVFEVVVSVPFFGRGHPVSARGHAQASARWCRALNAVEWRVPDCAAEAFACFRTAAGHILINRDGDALQPGPRRYTRSWIRDSVIMGAALAKAGHPAALRKFLRWYAPFQREDGFVPCVVDRDGVDWLVEHDSHGQFLWGVREAVRGGAGRAFLHAMLPHVRKAADFLLALRAQRGTDAYRAGERAPCCGLLPESVSHEGYLAHPVHAYWDDFWGVRGLEAAAELGAMAGWRDDAARWSREAGVFQEDVLRSFETVIRDKSLAYIPGSVEWADFDPTATSNAVAMLDFADALPGKPLRAMLQTYLEGVRRRRAGAVAWNNYTAYEIRLIGAFVRLGERETANELLAFFLSDRRPRDWNQWPEITWRDPRSPGHLGDLPHTWIAAEYLLALSSMVAEEREATGALVLAAGMPWAWLAEGKGFSVRRLPTRFGPLDFSIRAQDGVLIHVAVGGGLALPVGGLTVAPPLPPGRRVAATDDLRGSSELCGSPDAAVKITSLPFEGTIRLA